MGIEDIKTSKTHNSWDSITQPAEMKQLKELGQNYAHEPPSTNQE